MYKSLEDFYTDKAKEISFLELKKDYVFNDKLELKKEVMVPILIDRLVEGIKDSSIEESIKLEDIVEGMIFIIGANAKHNLVNEYIDFLEKYSINIESYVLAEAYKSFDKGNIDETIVKMNALNQICPNNPQYMYAYAFALEEKTKILLEEKDLETANLFVFQATRTLEHIIEIDEEYRMAYYKLGFHYYQNRLFIKAQVMWEKFLNGKTNSEIANDYIEEVEGYILGIQDEVTYEKGYSEILRGDTDSGLERLLSLEEKYPSWWNLHFMIGLGYRQRADFELAKDKFVIVLELMPDQIDAVNELGLCCAYLGENEMAIEQFDKILQTQPDNAEILCNRGMTFLQMGEIRRARADIEQAFEVSPDDDVTIACMQELKRHI